MASNLSINASSPIVIDPNAPDSHPVEHAIANTIRHGEHVLVKLISLLLLLLGLSDLYEALIDIFFIYPQLPYVDGYEEFFTSNNQHLIRSLAVFIGMSFIKTAYGLSLLIRDKHLIHRVEVITSISVLVLSILISHFAPHLDLEHQLPEIDPPHIHNLVHF